MMLETPSRGDSPWNLAGKAVGRSARERAHRGTRRWAPAGTGLEQLEARSLLSTITWDGGPAGTGTDFNTAANWAGDVLPGASDEAVIDIVAGPTISIAANTSVLSIQSVRPLNISGGTTTLSAASQLSDLSLTGVLSGAGDVTVTGTLTWNNGGDMVGTGRTILAAGATGTVIPTGSVTPLGRPFDVSGSLTLAGSGNLYFAGGTLTVLNGGVLNMTGSGLVNSSGTNAFIINAGGTLNKLGTGSLSVSGNIPLTNNGTVDVQAGTLTLQGTWTNNGAATVQGGATLTLSSNGTYGASSSLAGSGTVTFSSGTHTFPAGTFDPTGQVNFSGGTVTINNAFTPAGTITVNNTLTINAAQSWANQVVLAGGTLGGTGDITMTGTFTWNSQADMVGTGRTIVAGTGTVGPSGSTTLSRPMEVSGSLTLTSTGGIWFFNGGTLTVLSGGVFTINAASQSVPITGSGGTNAIEVNAGGMLIKQGPNTGTINIPLTSNGTVDVQSGLLTLNTGTWTNNGVATVQGGATLSLNTDGSYGAASSLTGPGTLTFVGSGTHSFPAGTFDPTGQVNFSGGTVTINNAFTPTGTITVNNTLTINAAQSWANQVVLAGGTLGGTGDITMTGTFTWNSQADMVGTGRTIVAGTGTVGPSGSTTLSRPMEVSGLLTLTSTGDNWAFNGGTLTVLSGGVFTINAPGGIPVTISSSGTNAIVVDAGGMLIKQGPNTGTIGGSNIPLTNNGTVDVQAGTLTIAGGTSNYSAATNTLSGGTWRVRPGSILRFSSPAGVSIRTLAPGTTVSLNGAGSNFTNSTGASALAALATINGALELIARDLPTTPVGGTLTNNGAITLGPGGSLTITGAYAQSASGMLNTVLAGTGAGEYGNLTASGAASLDGTLAATLDTGYAPAAPSVYDVVSAASRTGTFALVNPPTPAAQGWYSTEYTATGATLRYKLDTIPATSSVGALAPYRSQTQFLVSWSGQDDAEGSGLAFYTIYVSDNGGAFTPWLTDTTLTEAQYTGTDGHTYGFYSVATDNVGNSEAAPGTPDASTTVDATAPTSSIEALAAYLSGAPFLVRWGGTDSGSGVACYTVFVSDNGGAFTTWLTDTTLTEAQYTGTDGHTYAFYSVATDNVGNIEAAPGTPDAATTVDATAPSSAVDALPGYVAEGPFLVRWSGQDSAGGSGIASYSVFVSINGEPFQPWLSGTTLTEAQYTGAPGNTYAFYSTATDNVGNQESAPTSADAQTQVVPIPELQGFVINDGNAQRSMINSLTLTFDTAVILDFGAIELTRRAGGVFNYQVGNPSGDERTYVITFSGAGVIGGSLADGIYDVLVHADRVHSPYGIAMAGDLMFTFTRLFGDSDGDGDVDKADWALFRTALNSTSGDPAYIWWFDFDGNGSITSADSMQILSRLLHRADGVPV